MTFPLAPLPIVSQFFIDGAWVDAKTNGSSDFRYDEGIDINAGRKNEQGRVTATTVDATLNNRTGKWSDLNPLSPYYGKLPQNTLMRHYITGNSFAETYGGTFPNYGCIWSTDHADYDITGDIDIRIDCQFREWRNQGLAAKYITTGNQSWAVWIDELERIRLNTSSNGTNLVGNVASGALNIADGARKALRVTFDVDDGAGNRVATFYTADTIDGPWVQHGGAVSVAGTTSIFSGNADIEVGAVRWLGPYPSNGRFFAFEMYASLNGTSLRGHFDFRNVTLSGSPYLDSTTGKLWRPGNYNIQDPDFATYNPSRVVPASVRCCVEVAQWPQEWDSTGNDIYTPIQGAGILRRLTQGKKPVWSPFRRSILRQNDINSQLNILAYWPCEDLTGSRVVAAATPGTEPMQVDSPSQTSVEFEASATDDNGFETNFVLQGFGAKVLPGTLPLPNLAGGGRFIGKIPQGTSNPIEWGVQFVQRTNGLQAGENIVIARWETPGGTQKIWEVVHTSAGVIEVATYTSVGSARTVQLSTVNSQVILSQIRVDCRTHDITPTSLSCSLWIGGNLEDSQEIVTSIMARPTEIQINPDSNSITGTSGFYFGHLQIWDITFFYFMGYSEKGQTTQLEDEEGAPYYAFYRYLNERASDRLRRLCEDSGIDIEIIGDRTTTPRMGPQPDAELMDLLYECEDVDGGVLYEANDKIGFVYVCRSAILNYVSSLDLDYSAGHLSGVFRPNPDDLIVRNDVEVQSTTGSSARSTLITGKLSIQEPPDGVGVYDESRKANVAVDVDLPEIADQRRHVGTWNEPRYPSVEIGLHRAPFVASAGLRHDAYGMGVARFLSVSNVLSPPMAPDIINLLAQGYRETLRTFNHAFKFNCVPAGPYLFGRASNADIDNAVSRVAADGDMVLSLPVDEVTSRYTWDVDDESWVGEGSTTVQRVTSIVHDGDGALEAENTLGAGFGSLRFNDANQLPNDISAQGDTIRVWALVPNNTPGEGWEMHIEVQDSAFAWQAGPDYSMHPGVWQLLEYQTAPGLLANKRGIGIEAHATDVNATVTVLIDTMDQYNQDTALYVHSVSGDARWATPTDDDESADDFPMDAMVGGERVTVTDVDESLTETFDVADGATWPSWSVLDSGATLSVSGGTARQTQTAAGDLCILTRNARNINQRIKTLTTIDNGTITGAPGTTWIIARASDASNYYVLQLSWNTSDLIVFAGAKRSGGSLTSLVGHAGTQRTILTGFGAGTEVMVDFMVLGTAPTRIYAKAWVPASQTEPIGWQIYTTDTDANLESGTLVGLGSRRETGNTNANLQFQYRDFHILTPQLLTVTRGVNGILKPHNAGSEIEVVESAYVGR
jgi:hypothetical protein